LLASCEEGCTEALLEAHGYRPEALASLVHSGLAAAHLDRERAGAKVLEVLRFSITPAGRQILGQG
jgi:hypothetical protein